jgi:hypothetical protein
MYFLQTYIILIYYKITCHRLPAVVVEVTHHDNDDFYKLAVVGGLLNVAYKRSDIQHELTFAPSTFGLEGLVANWQDLPKISVREGVKKISLTDGQGYLKCQCTSVCQTQKCKCFKEGRKCNSRCHPKNSQCFNHDMHSGDEEDGEEVGEEI